MECIESCINVITKDYKLIIGPALKFVLTQTPVDRMDIVDKGMTAEDLISLGLFTYDTKKRTLMCPFVVLSLLCYFNLDPILGHKKLSGMPKQVSFLAISE